MFKNWYLRENVRYVSILLVLSLFYSQFFPSFVQANTAMAAEQIKRNAQFPIAPADGDAVKKQGISAFPVGGKANGVTNGLVAHYQFNGNADDMSGNNNGGTVQGAALTNDRQGAKDCAYRFDGVNDYISIPCINNDEISLCAWFCKDANDPKNADSVFGGWRTNPDTQKREGFAIKFYASAPNMVKFIVVTQDAQGNRKQRMASYDLTNSVGSWYHVVGAYNKTTGEQRLYVNGLPVKTMKHPAGNTIVPLTYYPDMKIGNSGPDGYFNGVIDDVRLYNRPLSDQEVQELYHWTPQVNQPPVVDAGTDQTITLPGTATLNGSVSDDGLPEGSAVSIEWSKVSGPGVVGFENINQAVTTASFSEPGTYELHLSASDSALTGSDHVIITVNAGNQTNQAPIVSAGEDQTIMLYNNGGAGTELAYKISDDGLPQEGYLTFAWSKVSGHGNVIFRNDSYDSRAVTFARFSAAGVYELQLSASDAELTGSDTVTVTVEPYNGAPWVEAGRDLAISLPNNTANLNGYVSDDGLPEGSVLAIEWSKIGGTGTVTFENPNEAVTTASFSEPGTYELQLSASDTRLTGSDTATIRVYPEGTANQTPTVNAGEDKTAYSRWVTITGSVSDDGLPENSALFATWYCISGPGYASFSYSPYDPTVTASVYFSTEGVYELQLNASDSEFTSSDTVTITVRPYNGAPWVNAGSDQATSLPHTAHLNGYVFDDGLPAGSTLAIEWSKIGGTGEVIFANPNQAVTTASFSNPGTYELHLSASDSELTGNDTVTIKVSPEGTANQAPVVDAGTDRFVLGGHYGFETYLYGSGSDDGLPAGNALTFTWSKVSGPGDVSFENPNSYATEVSFSAPGKYVLHLSASDSELTSSDTVTITAFTPPNQAPYVDSGEDGSTTMYDGEAWQWLSGDVYDDGLPAGSTLAIEWSKVSGPGDVSFEEPNYYYTGASFNTAGVYVLQLSASDSEFTGSDTVTVTVEQNNERPEVDAGTDQFIELQETVTLNGSVADDGLPEGIPLAITWSMASGPGTVTFANPNQAVTTATFSEIGEYWLDLRADDSEYTDSDSVQITVLPENLAPTVSAGVDKTVALPLSGVLKGSVVDDLRPEVMLDIAWSKISGPGDVTFENPNQAVTTATFSEPGDYELQLSVSDSKFTVQDTVIIAAITVPDAWIPSDPAAAAPPLDPIAFTPLAGATSFLYTGDNPIQLGVGEDTIEAIRCAVLRGRVTDRSGAAISGVTVTILGHPEFGLTRTRGDGMFDMVVNGGGLLTVEYEKDGYLAVQRQVDAPWEDYAWLPEAVMIHADTKVTTIDLSSGEPMQVAQGNVVQDDDGARTATLFFPAGTEASIYNEDGTIQNVTNLNLRLTEYTVGDKGPESMPAPLPPASGYTYCVELGVDEAQIKVDGKDVVFNQPVIFYVDNFLNFPIGIDVPVGYYDRDRGQWMPYDNGRVIKILSIANDMAELDTDGDADVDNGVDLGVTDAERQRLAALYQPGKSLWRETLNHLSTWDSNWGVVPPDDAEEPNVSEPEPEPDDQNQCTGSTIGMQRQTLGEDVGITGAPFSLHYQSDLMPGYTSNYSVEIPLSGDSIPASLYYINLGITVAGREFHHWERSPEPAIAFPFTWDGKNAYGQTVQGPQTINMKIEYAYRAQYGTTSRFGYNGNGRIITGTRQDLYLSKEWISSIGALNVAKRFGGWTPDIYHTYEPSNKTLYLGGGDRITGKRRFGSTITTVAGNPIGIEGSYSIFMAPFWRNCSINPEYCRREDALYRTGLASTPAPALKTRLNPMGGITFSPTGQLYMAEGDHVLLLRERRSNTSIESTDDADARVLDGYKGYWIGEGIADWEEFERNFRNFSNLNDVKCGPDSSIYVTSGGGFGWTGEHYIFRKAPNSVEFRIFAGTGEAGFSGDGGPATQAAIGWPTALAIGPDGSVYFCDTNNHRVRRIGTDGIIQTVAGCGVQNGGYFGSDRDNKPALEVEIIYPWSLAVGADGSIYVGEEQHIGKVDTAGIYTIVAGIGYWSDEDEVGDGLPAREARILHPRDIEIGPDGCLYILEERWGSGCVRRIGTDGIITTVVADNDEHRNGINTGDGGLATQARLGTPGGIAFAPNGAMYISSNNIDNGNVYSNGVIRRVGTASKTFTIASKDGSEVYEFDPANGRHLRTLNAFTNSIIYEFQHNGAGYLTSVTDGNGNVTTIERDGDDNPVAIVSPYGQRTAFELNADGLISRITNPAGESIQPGYNTGGLLTSLTDARGNTKNYIYDDMGKLIKDTDPVGGYTAISRSDFGGNDFEITRTTAEGRTGTFMVENLSDGTVQNTSSLCCGNPTVSITGTTGTTETTYPNGTIANTLEGPDPRFGMQSPILRSKTVTTPGGLVHTMAMTREVTLSDPSNRLSLLTQIDTQEINGRKYRSVFDATARTITFTSPMGRVSTTTLDDKGRIRRAESTELSPVNFDYDVRGKLTRFTTGTDADARITTLSYNSDGYLDVLSNPLSQDTHFEYDKAGRRTKQIMIDSSEIGLAYDANGNTTSVTPPWGTLHAFSYTKANLAEMYNPPAFSALTPQTRYEYNLDKQLSRITLPDGQAVEYVYNSAGKLAHVTMPGNKGIEYAYDESTGQLNRITAPDGGALSFAYDGTLLLNTALSGEIHGGVSQTYNNDFRITSNSVNEGLTIDYQYDSDGLLIRAGDILVGRNAQNGMITGTTMGNVTTTLDYNTFGEVIDYRSWYASGSLSLQFERDKLGRITEKREMVNGTAYMYNYDYDVRGRLIRVRKDGAVVSEYAYDGNGNRLRHTTGGGVTTGTYDAQDRLLAYGNKSYHYTVNGELQARTDTSTHETTAYTYDVMGNLVSVTLPDGRLIEYVVSGNNRRIGKKVNGVLTQGFLYQDPLKPIAELDGNNNVVSRFVYATHANVPDYLFKGGETYRIITDHLGSPRLVVNISSGQIIQHMDYDEFGNVISDTNPGFQPFGFAGGLYDNDTRLVRFGARDYDAETGRWTAKDPILFFGGDTNIYVYCMSDPVNSVDPNGTIPAVNLAGAIFGFVSGLLSSIAADMIQNPGGPINVPAMIIGGLTGAASGFIAPILALETGLSVTALQMGLGGLSNGIQALLNLLFNSQPRECGSPRDPTHRSSVDLANAMISIVAGAVLSFIGALIPGGVGDDVALALMRQIGTGSILNTLSGTLANIQWARDYHGE